MNKIFLLLFFIKIKIINKKFLISIKNQIVIKSDKDSDKSDISVKIIIK